MGTTGDAVGGYGLGFLDDLERIAGGDRLLPTKRLAASVPVKSHGQGNGDETKGKYVSKSALGESGNHRTSSRWHQCGVSSV